MGREQFQLEGRKAGVACNVKKGKGTAHYEKKQKGKQSGTGLPKSKERKSTTGIKDRREFKENTEAKNVSKKQYTACDEKGETKNGGTRLAAKIGRKKTPKSFGIFTTFERGTFYK